MCRTTVNMFSSKYFNMGKVVFTATLHNAMSENSRFAKDVIMAINRYSNKDWGELTEDDQQVNEDALQYPDDLYLLGAYKTCKGKIYIITNRISEKAGINATTICFPDER